MTEENTHSVRDLAASPSGGLELFFAPSERLKNLWSKIYWFDDNLKGYMMDDWARTELRERLFWLDYRVANVEKASHFQSDQLNNLYNEILRLESNLGSHKRSVLKKRQWIAEFGDFIEEYKSTFKLSDEEFLVEHIDELRRVLAEFRAEIVYNEELNEYCKDLENLRKRLDAYVCIPVLRHKTTRKDSFRSIVAFGVKNLDDAHALQRYDLIEKDFFNVKEASYAKEEYSWVIAPHFKQRAA